MPLYEYHCSNCEQLFTEMRSITAYQEPSPCPDCNQPAARVIASAPRLNNMPASVRKAYQTNERSAHEPRMRHAHQCGSGCNHNHSREKKPETKQQLGQRPWMLGH